MSHGNSVEKYLKALAHPARRKVLVALAEKKSLSYSELMRISGIEDSGTFAFHLKMLQGLVEKDPETGDYKLTKEGYKAYEALKILYGESRVVEPVSRGQGGGEGGVVVVSDKLSFDLTKEFAEKIASKGKRVLITDVLVVNIEDMPEELLDKVLEGIHDVLVVNAPRNLRHVVELKSKDVFVVGKSSISGGFIGGLVKTIVNAIASSIARIPWRPISGREKRYVKKVVDTPSTYILTVDADASKITFKKNTSSNKVVVEGEFHKDSEPVVEVVGDTVKTIVDAGSATIAYPDGLDKLVVKADASSIDGVVQGVKQVVFDCDASNIGVELKDLRESRISIKGDASNIVLDIGYKEFKGLSEITIDADVSNIKLNIVVGKETSIQALIEEGVGTISVNGFTGKHYTDKEFGKAESKLRITARNESGVTRINISRK